MKPTQAVLRVRHALESGELAIADLSARKLGRFLGQTTSVLYHHFGSLDGFLYAVSISGFVAMAEETDQLAVAGRGLEAAASRYVHSAFDRPALYELMYRRRFDWAALRASGRLDIPGNLAAWHALVALLAKLGSPKPEEDARLFHAGLHGIIDLATTGRMNIGDLSRSDREVALRTARRLARTITQRFS